MVLIQIVEKNEMLSIDKDVTENQHAVKVLTQKGICGAVLSEQYLPSGEHKNYDHVLTSNSTNILSTFQVNNFHVTMHVHNLLSDGNQTDGNTLERFRTPYQNSRLPLRLQLKLLLQKWHIMKINLLLTYKKKSFNLKSFLFLAW